MNLALADIPKDHTAFDLAIAATILSVTDQIRDSLEHTAILGELGLDGHVRPSRGVIGKILVGKRHGITRFIILADNVDQAVLVAGVILIPIETPAQMPQ